MSGLLRIHDLDIRDLTVIEGNLHGRRAVIAHTGSCIGTCGECKRFIGAGGRITTLRLFNGSGHRLLYGVTGHGRTTDRVHLCGLRLQKLALQLFHRSATLVRGLIRSLDLYICDLRLTGRDGDRHLTGEALLGCRVGACHILLRNFRSSRCRLCRLSG